MIAPTLPAVLRVGSQTFEAGSPLSDVQDAINGVLLVNADLGADNQALRAEIGRLKAALERIAKCWERDEERAFGNRIFSAADCQRIARQALLPVSSEGGLDVT